MATDQASTLSSPRNLWQVPLFLLGLGAVLLIVFAGEKLRPSLTDRFNRQINLLRIAYEKNPPNLMQIQAALRAMPIGEPPDEIATRVYFHLGCAYVVLAEESHSNESAEWWSLARQRFERVKPTELNDTDRPRYFYRLAKTWAYSSDISIEKAIEALTSSVRSADDPAEGYRLLNELYLKTNPPDPLKAKEALKNYLKHATTRVDQKELAVARLKLAQMHLADSEQEEARKVIERITQETPKEFNSARLLLGKILITRQEWANAAKILEELRVRNDFPEAEKHEMEQLLAEAYLKLNRSEEANHILQASLKKSGPVNFRLLAQLLNDPNTPNAELIQVLEGAMRDVSANGEISGGISQQEARTLLNDLYRRCRDSNDFAAALRVARSAQRLNGELASRELQADVYQAWALALTREGKGNEETRATYRKASEELAWVAAQKKSVSEKGDLLRRAAGLSLRGDDASTAIDLLSQVTTLSGYPEEEKGGTLLELAEAYRLANKLDLAGDAYRAAASYVGPDQTKARVKYAQLLLNRSDAAQNAPAIVNLLTEALKDPAVSKDPSIREAALYTLGEALFVSRDWIAAEEALKLALNEKPDSSLAPNAKLYLAKTFWFRAREEAAHIKTDQAELDQLLAERKAKNQPTYKIDQESLLRDRIDAAWDRYEKYCKNVSEISKSLVSELERTPGIAEPELYRRATFIAADSSFLLGNYSESNERYSRIAKQYAGRVEQLEALANMYRSCRQAMISYPEEPEWGKKLLEVFDLMKQAYAELPPSELDESSDIRKKTYWERWFQVNNPKK